MLRVFTEGRDDTFIKIYLEYLGYELGKDFTVDKANGWSNIHLIAPKIRELVDNTDNKVVFVFDADSESNGGGCEIRRGQISTLLSQENLEADLFLFPNNIDDGDFESLLINIACEKRGALFNCFDGYEGCVRGLETDTLKFQLPMRKSRIFAYIESFDESNNLKAKEIKERTYFFSSNKYWKLDSEHLNNLKEFLENAISK